MRKLHCILIICQNFRLKWIFLSKKLSFKAIFISDTKIRPFIGQEDHDFLSQKRVIRKIYAPENIHPRTRNMLLGRTF